MTPKQRGGGSRKTGNTSHGHRSNRISSSHRGGNAHAGGGGFGKKPPTKGCLWIVVATAAVMGSGAYGVVEIL